MARGGGSAAPVSSSPVAVSDGKGGGKALLGRARGGRDEKRAVRLFSRHCLRLPFVHSVREEMAGSHSQPLRELSGGGGLLGQSPSCSFLPAVRWSPSAVCWSPSAVRWSPSELELPCPPCSHAWSVTRLANLPAQAPKGGGGGRVQRKDRTRQDQKSSVKRGKSE